MCVISMTRPCTSSERKEFARVVAEERHEWVPAHVLLLAEPAHDSACTACTLNNLK
jgi:hypothetical protein